MSDEQRLRGCRFALRVFLSFVLLSLILCYFGVMYLKGIENERKARERLERLKHPKVWAEPDRATKP